MKPDDMIRTALIAILAIAGAGAVLGFDPGPAITLVVQVLTWLLPGAIVGLLVGAIVTAVTRELPKGLLFGGTTTLVLTIVLRIIFWIDMHTPK
jgi:hypothetical protein